MTEDERRQFKEVMDKIGTPEEEGARLAELVKAECEARQEEYDDAETKEEKKAIATQLFKKVTKDTASAIVRLAIKQALKIESQKQKAPQN